MGQSKKFADHFDRLAAERYAAELPSMVPYTLPREAFGPREMERFRPGRPVWAWLQWPNGDLTRSRCVAVMANDRVVLVEWERGTAMSRSTFVWRQAVTHRQEQLPGGAVVAAEA